MNKKINIKEIREEKNIVVAKGSESKFDKWIDSYTESPDNVFNILEKISDEVMKKEPSYNNLVPNGYKMAGAMIKAEDENILTETYVVNKLVKETVEAYGEHEEITSLEDALVKSHKNEDGTVSYILTTLVKA